MNKLTWAFKAITLQFGSVLDYARVDAIVNGVQLRMPYVTIWSIGVL